MKIAAGLGWVALLCATSMSTTARADYDGHHHGYPRNYRPLVLIEGTGGYGFQFGETEYLPSGAGDIYQHPMVHGYSVGGTLGVFLDPNLALIATYEYASAQSSRGDVPGVIDRIEGSIDFHTATAGLRLYHPIGFGRIRGELALGVLFPYSTELTVTHGAGLTQLPMPITGEGTRRDNYSVGFGGHAALGYEFPIVAGLYGALQVKYRLFQSENSGETTELRNFVTDYEAAPPRAVDATITHGDGAERPVTTSVQDVRLQATLGWMF
jgi:hypothetical protein